MKHKRSRGGFTIVELIIVVVIIVILATVTFAVYANTQMQARDTRIRDGAQKIADSMEIWSANHPGVAPATGENSSGSATANGCSANTGNNFGWVAPTNYQCTWGDVLVVSGYLTTAFFDSQPPNTQTIWGSSSVLDFTMYVCGSDKYLLYTLEDPTAADDASMSMFRSTGACSWHEWLYTQAGMRAAIKLNLAY